MLDSAALLRAQWKALRTWMATDGIAECLDRPSVLPGWTVADLIAHTGRSFIATELTINDPGGQAQSLRSYLAHYPPAAEEISEATQALAAEIRDGLLGGLDEIAERGFAHLDDLTAPVLRGLRGGITRDDFVLTRLIEVVVHADDLARSLPEIEPPMLLDEAVALVSDALAGAYAEAAGAAPSYPPGLPWIRLAAGRVPSTDPVLPLL
jgi:uncharacterized protein (TIGR03083 family)